jgi:hypothetical protein
VGGNPVNLVDPSGLRAEFKDCLIFRYNDENGSCFGGNFLEVAGDLFAPAAEAVVTCQSAINAGGGVAVQELARIVLKRVIPLGVAAAVSCVGVVGFKEAVKGP